ncbi:MAG: Gldg family protein, partial [Oscillospiraceae bacterium]|nr:Gldg family protein [Oscillospiraceae bacterium]
ADQKNLGAYDIIFETSSVDSQGNKFKRVKVVGLMDMVNIKEEILEYYVSAGYDTASIDSEIETYVMNYGHSSTFSLYNSYGMLGTSNAETAFVSAFMAVVDDNPITITFLNANRSEAELPYFKSLLDANGYMVNEINISTDEIPEDTNVLVMAAPKLDYTSEEIDKIDKFLDNDGNLKKSLIYMASVEQGETPNIDEFLEEYGLVIENSIIGEYEEGYYYSGNPFLTRQFMVGEYYLDGFDADENAYFYVPYSRAITPLYEEDGMKVVWTYLASSSNAYTVDIDTEEKKQKGMLYSMVIGAKSKFVEDAEGNVSSDFSHVIAFGTEGFFADSALASAMFENSDMIITMLNEITNKKQGIIITPKAVNAVTFDINEKQANMLKYTFVFIIPAVILITGFVIYLRRKNK